MMMMMMMMMVFLAVAPGYDGIQKQESLGIADVRYLPGGPTKVKPTYIFVCKI